MIRKLRVKFVCVNMLIVTIMLCVILGLVLHSTRQSIQMQSVSMMQRIGAVPFQHGLQEMQLPFLSVQIGHRGELLAAWGSYNDLSDLQEIVTAALSDPADTGVLSEYHLRWCKVISGGVQTIVFSDTTAEETSLRNLTIGCIAIGLAGFAAFFAISIALSRWAVKPVAQAWEQQRQFVADASHELKTPLAVILANAELLDDESCTPEERSRFSRNVLSTSYQMRTLVENLLQMARVDNAAPKMTMTVLDFSQLVSDAVLSFQLLYEEQGMGLHSEIAEGIPINGSEPHLYQVLDVLLDNALKYSTPGSRVSVMLARQSRGCLLTVTSPGQPLSPEECKNIFKRFYRADKARARNGSYGLGLSIAQTIVTAHKGKIWAEAREGCNLFHVQFP